ncbi:ABC transporter permease subunit [Candidatus Oscillochloris fontis]|uniref:ABC transporter permease subunit n=1 Tax=Candidatus Oscillochloris fontis TaxID=2496868 RepID=UPI001EE895C0|nr:ABC transporter permease subunit [Candidatus Oscillochloris fontis]
MITELGNLIAAEWLKLRRRPMAWILLATFLGLLLFYLATWAMVVALHEGTLSGGTTRIMLLSEPQIDELKRQLSFPGIFGAVLGQVNSTGGICAIILAAGFVGSEYGWGTFRLLLTRAPHRGFYLVAKLLTLLLGLLGAILVALLLGSLIAMVCQASLGLSSTLHFRALLLLPLGVARSLLVILPYVMLTITSSIFGRSVLAGVGGGLMFLALDMSAGSINTLAGVDPLVQMLVNLLLQPNINTLIVMNSQLFGLDQSLLVGGLDLSHLPSPLHATLVILVYSGGFFWTAYRLLLRRDVAGAL